MNSKTTKRFRQMLAKLPSDIRQQAKEAYKLFRENPYHPSLQFKKVHRTELIYAARININYRAVGVVDGGELFGSGSVHMQNMRNYSVNFKILINRCG